MSSSFSSEERIKSETVKEHITASSAVIQGTVHQTHQLAFQIDIIDYISTRFVKSSNWRTFLFHNSCYLLIYFCS